MFGLSQPHAVLYQFYHGTQKRKYHGANVTESYTGSHWAPERKRDHGYKHGWFLWGLIPRPHASVGLSHSCRELQGLWKVCSSLCPEGKENVFWPTWKSLLQIL